METATRTHLRHSVAEEVCAVLGRRRMSGAKLARAIDRSEMYVSRRLRAETAFDLDDLERIADVLSVSVHDLLPKRSPVTSGYQISPESPPRGTVRPTTPRPSGGPAARTRAPSSRRPVVIRR